MRYYDTYSRVDSLLEWLITVLHIVVKTRELNNGRRPVDW